MKRFIVMVKEQFVRDVQIGMDDEFNKHRDGFGAMVVCVHEAVDLDTAIEEIALQCDYPKEILEGMELV